MRAWRVARSARWKPVSAKNMRATVPALLPSGRLGAKGERMQKIGTRIARQPELNLFMFAFLLNLPWELVQIPLFREMPTLAHLEGVIRCARAAAGDGLIMLLAFWLVACVVGSRRWIAHPSAARLCGFIGIGLGITIAMEYWATAIAGRWEYADAMPKLPLLGTGLMPLLQWMLIPPLVVWLTRRQLK